MFAWLSDWRGEEPQHLRETRRERNRERREEGARLKTAFDMCPR